MDLGFKARKNRTHLGCSLKLYIPGPTYEGFYLAGLSGAKNLHVQNIQVMLMWPWTTLERACLAPSELSQNGSHSAAMVTPKLNEVRMRKSGPDLIVVLSSSRHEDLKILRKVTLMGS